MHTKSIIENYLKNYGEAIEEPSIKDLGLFDYVLCIPAYKEGADFVESLKKILFGPEKVLIIVVINAPENADSHAVNQNQELKKKLFSLGPTKDNRVIGSGSEIFLLGPITVPTKQGVGKARKIACDLALKLIAGKKVSLPIIFSSDADAKLPDNYFSSAEKVFCKNNFSALAFNYIHEQSNCEKQNLAISLYELRMEQYVVGLKSAGSPYAYHTIGSTIAILASAYAKARGFPKIVSGEDFHLLNKLRKLGPVLTPDSDPIVLSSRVSDRVLFGTGPSLKKILAYNDPKEAPLFYPNECFYALKKFLDVVEENIHDEKIFDRDKLGLLIKENFLLEIIFSLPGIESLIKNLSQRKKIKDRMCAFTDWFDALKTLQFINGLLRKNMHMKNFYQAKKDLCNPAIAIEKKLPTYRKNIFLHDFVE